MVDKTKLDFAIKKAESVLEGFELEFFKRIWNSDLDKYKKRLQAIGFQNQARVLDAGFGNAQWTLCLAEMNKHVEGIEYTESRVKVGQILKQELAMHNINLAQGSIDSMPYEDNSFDAIFCYGVIFLTDYRKSLSELYRVLKKGGKLYFTANSLGWYIMCIIEEHNKSANYDPRQMAIETIEHSFNYFTKSRPFETGKQLFVTKAILETLLEDVKFKNWHIKPEGHINIDFSEPFNQSFYKHQKYQGQDFIFDVMCYK